VQNEVWMDSTYTSNTPYYILVVCDTTACTIIQTLILITLVSKPSRTCVLGFEAGLNAANGRGFL